ncbi:hypothetical protein CMUS01_03431 [Colletotrichum musicola]|uniref:Uncharacterized protein n=1 Tax=Colletotrichum musicola TaxID=2175873 RepID=A0A8H6U5X5_9PEZI|nr:hypothetical protein CMUS01_03431 [Colletotrichum musicola]
MHLAIEATVPYVRPAILRTKLPFSESIGRFRFSPTDPMAEAIDALENDPVQKYKFVWRNRSQIFIEKIEEYSDFDALSSNGDEISPASTREDIVAT